MLSGMSHCRLAVSTNNLALIVRKPRCYIRRRPEAVRAAVGSRARSQLCRFQSSTSTSQASATSQEIRTLQQEIKSLKELLQQQQQQSASRAPKPSNDTNSNTIETLADLTRNLTARTAQIELRLDQINDHVSKIGALEKIAGNARDLLQHNAAVRGVVNNLETIVQRSRPYFTKNKYAKYIVFGLISVSAIVWKFRQKLVYERTSEEVADLARRTLEQESLRSSIQETLQTVANSKATLATLNDLVQALIAHERTQQDLVHLLVFAVNTPEVQAALLELLQVVVKDETLQQLVGEFLLKGLDMESVKEMLDAQTAELVRDTVSDDSVQQATAVGLQRSVMYSITPSYLWRFLEKQSKKFSREEDARDESSGSDKDDGKLSTDDDNAQPNTEPLPSQ